MSESNRKGVEAFDNIRQLLDDALHTYDNSLTIIKTQSDMLNMSIPTDPQFKSIKKEMDSLKLFYHTEELRAKEQISWFKVEIQVLKILSLLFNQVFEEMDSLNYALRSMGVEMKDIKSSQEKREETFNEIEKYVDEIIKRDNEEREKWR